MKVRGSTNDLFDFIEGPDGFKAFRSIIITATGSDLPCDVEMTAAVEGDSYIVNEVRCTRRRRGPEVSGEVIRAIPVAGILRNGALQANKILVPRASSTDYRALGPVDESLRAVALVYRMARLVRDDPTQAVSAALGLPRPTASRWVQTARSRGFLGAAEPRKPGERS
jgi:hypothetical protein